MKKQLLTLSLSILACFPLYGYAEEVVTLTATTTKEITESTTTDVTPTKLFTLCSQEAIEKRDTRIAVTRSIYNTAMTSALNERKNKEKAAVALGDEGDKKSALKVSVETYKSQAKSAQSALTQARKIAWQTFENDIKKCRETQTEEEALLDIKESDATQGSTSMKKLEEPEVKGIKETIKAQLESFRSLFN